MFYFLFYIFIPLELFSHQTGLSYIDLKDTNKNIINVIYKKPLNDAKAKNITINYPLQCQQVTPLNTSIVNGFIIETFSLSCLHNTLNNKKIWIEGLLSNDRGVMIRYETKNSIQKALLRASTPFIEFGENKSSLTLFKEYMLLGMEHIFSGFDHLLFVFTLLLLATSFKNLLFAISAFTLSHSITLALAILGFVSISIPFVESMIALSIVFLAKELYEQKKDTFTKQHLWITTFIFGLLHGFGFSSALSSIGLPQNEIALSLFAFNIGIESGQIIFVIGVGSITIGIQKFLLKNKEKFLKIVLAYIVGTLASYWLIERILSI